MPLFHDLEKVAKVDSIPGLNLHSELQSEFKDFQIKIFYELINGFDPKKELLIWIPGGPGQTHADLHSLESIFQIFAPSFLQNFNIIVMDHRGVGCSKPLSDRQYAMGFQILKKLIL